MKTEIIEKIIEYFEENDEVFADCIEELDSYNGYLGDDRCYDMYELNEIYNGQDPIDILYRAFYGYDGDTWTTDADGTKHYGEFNPNRDYFRFNGYGNLVSSDYKDYSDKLDDYAIIAMGKNRQWIDTIEDYEDLAALFDDLEECENEMV